MPAKRKHPVDKDLFWRKIGLNMINLITGHMDIWTAAQIQKRNGGRGRGNNSNGQSVYGIKKLRELILELAVMGKLVPQDPNDEPASVLLGKITREKARLIKEGKIKKEKPLPGIGEGERPFELPVGWEWTRLGSISQINPRNEAEDNLTASFIPMPLITTSHTGEHGQEIKTWGEIKKGYTHFADGDIGVAKITPCFENSKAIVLSGLENGIGAGTTELHIARPFYSTLAPRYILLFLKAPMFLKVGETKLTGTAGQKRVPKEFFSETPLPLPPLAEQHRIVAKVDELMAVCDQLEQQQIESSDTHQNLVETLLATLTNATDQKECAEAWQRMANHFDTLFTTEQSIDQLKQTILQLAVMGKLVLQDPNDEPASVLLEKIAMEKARLMKAGKIKKEKPLPEIREDEKPFELPRGWEWARLSRFTIVGTGATPARINPSYYFPEEINWVTSGETSDDFITETREKISLLAVSETNVTVYPIGTLIVAMYGQGKTRGQVSELVVKAGTNQACAAIQPVVSEVHHRKYIKLFFKKAYEELRRQAAGGAQPNLNLGKVAQAVIPLPPLAEQHRIVAKVNELMALCDTLKARLNAAQTTQIQLADAIVEQAVA